MHARRPQTIPSAIEKAAHLIPVLSTAELPDGTSVDFPLTGKLTVTAITGGQGYSVTPDLCTLNVDIRTTPTFDSHAATRLFEKQVAEVDNAWPDTQPTRIQNDTGWPAYTLTDQSPLRTAILDAAGRLGIALEAKVAGPSNVSNYLAGLGIPATAGFGVDYLGLHATDERIRVDTIPTVHATYYTALRTLLTG